MLIVDSEKLTALLIDRQQSLIELARQAGLCPSTVARWVRAESPANVHLKSVAKLARVLGVDWQHVVKRKED